MSRESCMRPKRTLGTPRPAIARTYWDTYTKPSEIPDLRFDNV